MKTNIFVVAHKPGWPEFPQGYTVIQAGAAMHEHLPEADAWDDAGDNISERNANFCELTALWWMTHHAQEDILGLAHYRRLFSFAPCRNPFLEHYRMKKEDERLARMLDTERVSSLLDGYDILLPYKLYLKESVRGQYCRVHRSEDLAVLEEVFCARYPAQRELFQRAMQGHLLYAYNMFVARRDIACAYADWLFDILFEVADRTAISEDPYQARVFGFLSERLMSVFVEWMHLRVRELPLIFIEDAPSFPWHRKGCRSMLANLGLLSWT